MNNEAKLLFKDDFIKIINFEYHNYDIYYNTSFDIEVRSGCFCGQAPCEYDIKEFRRFVCELTEMYSMKKQTVTLNDICYGSTVKFEADKIGHIQISGEIFGSGMEHILKFSFTADQTVLKSFIEELQQLIAD